MGVGRLAARAGRSLVSGGAKGIDQAAMRGALEAGGTVSGVLADSLEKTAMNRENRNFLLEGQLVLISPYDPSAGFNVGNAMQRNKLIYALADASLVISSDVKKGGTWAGATEQLEKLKFVPVYVRSTGEPSAGLDALRAKGAMPWPNPEEPDALQTVFEMSEPTLVHPSQQGLERCSGDVTADVASSTTSVAEPRPPNEMPSGSSPSTVEALSLESIEPTHVTAFLDSSPPQNQPEPAGSAVTVPVTPADSLFSVVRDAITLLLKIPMKDAEVAEALDVTAAQAKVWLLRLVDEGVLEKQKKPSGYIIKQSRLL